MFQYEKRAKEKKTLSCGEFQRTGVSVCVCVCVCVVGGDNPVMLKIPERTTLRIPFRRTRNILGPSA